MTVHVTVVFPSANGSEESFTILAMVQLSSVIGDPSATLVAVHRAASVSTVTLIGAVIVGSILSTTVTV